MSATTNFDAANAAKPGATSPSFCKTVFLLPSRSRLRLRCPEETCPPGNLAGRDFNMLALCRASALPKGLTAAQTSGGGTCRWSLHASSPEWAGRIFISRMTPSAPFTVFQGPAVPPRSVRPLAPLQLHHRGCSSTVANLANACTRASRTARLRLLAYFIPADLSAKASTRVYEARASCASMANYDHVIVARVAPLDLVIRRSPPLWGSNLVHASSPGCCRLLLSTLSPTHLPTVPPVAEIPR